MCTICGLDCCGECPQKAECGGCTETKGHPFGGSCLAADYIKQHGMEAFEDFKEKLTKEVEQLGIQKLKMNGWNLLNGSYVNLEYPLSNGQCVKLLKDDRVYLGTQIEVPGSDRCYGVVADKDMLLVCEYGCGGSDPEIVLLKRR